MDQCHLAKSFLCLIFSQMSEQRPFRRKVFLLAPEFPSYGICGSRGSGKSVLLEFTMEWYLKHNYIGLDWFGSIDHENAYWCIPDMVAIGRWMKLEDDDSSKLIEYIKAWFPGIKDETGFQVQREDDRTVYCTTEHFTFKLELDRTLHEGALHFNPDTPIPKKYSIRAFKNSEGELIVYGKNPRRVDRDRIRVKGYPVLIIIPKTTIIKQNNPLCICGIPLSEHALNDSDKANWRCKYGKVPLIKTITDDTPLKEIIHLAADEKRICIFNRGFYGDQRDAYRTLAKMLKELPFLILRGSLPKNQCYCIGFREAGQIAPSGLKGMRGDYETNVKRELQTYIREARHLRTVLVLDYQRQGDIAKSISSQRDFQFVKKSTRDLLPDGMDGMFDAIEQRKQWAIENLDWDRVDEWPSISRLKHHESYVLFPDAHYEFRSHAMPCFHHKRPDDNWAFDSNCEIQYLEKKDLDKEGIDKKIVNLKKKREDKAEKYEVLKEADRLHEDGSTWTDLAKKYGWLDKTTGMPSGDRLKMAVRRWKESQDTPGNNGTNG